MDPFFIAVAFILGLAARRVGLPPLAGFLVSGFVLHAFGYRGGEALDQVAEIGVLLLLFTIGLKLQVKSLLRPEIWAGTTVHMAIMITVVGAVFLGLGAVGMPLFVSMNLGAAALLAFALSFSSTVFAVKVLEERGEIGSLHGRTAIGVLIMQDIFAVLFLTLASGKVPSLWALALVPALILLRPLLHALVDKSGHGEIVVLCGLFLAIVVGAAGFEGVGLKPDLGALCLGILVGQSSKAKELGSSLMGVKDLFLVGVFLSIGLNGFPSLGGWIDAGLLLLLIPLKVALFFVIFVRFHFRARSAWIAALNLGNFSEFGLIVMTVAAAGGWLNPEWLVVTAVAVAGSFLISSPLNRFAETLYAKWKPWLIQWETRHTHPDDLPVRREDEFAAIFGMGRIGVAAYDILHQRYPGKVLGFDLDPESVAMHQQAGRNVLMADATDSDFWEKIQLEGDIHLVVLALPKHEANVQILHRLKQAGFDGVVAAVGQFPDDVVQLKELGVDTAYNLYTQAGNGFARHVYRVFEQQRPDLTRMERDADNAPKFH